VSRRQLLALGWSAEAIRHRVETGRLVVVHRGVYAAGRAELSDRGRIVAALLAAGPGAVASHWTAAFLYELIRTLPAVIDVTILGRGRRSRPGLHIHETTRPFEVRRRQGIPLTAPLRTLADLPHAESKRATTEALVRRLVKPHELPNDRAPTRSPLEDRLLRLIRKAPLPEPLVNHRIGAYTVDFFWADHGLVVETDGYATHGHRDAFERDRARDAALIGAGYVVLRFTHRQIEREPEAVVRVIAVAVSRGSRAPARALA
jgi:very-short-patch-repair endonuclease